MYRLRSSWPWLALFPPRRAIVRVAMRVALVVLGLLATQVVSAVGRRPACASTPVWQCREAQGSLKYFGLGAIDDTAYGLAVYRLWEQVPPAPAGGYDIRLDLYPLAAGDGAAAGPMYARGWREVQCVQSVKDGVLLVVSQAGAGGGSTEFMLITAARHELPGAEELARCSFADGGAPGGLRLLRLGPASLTPQMPGGLGSACTAELPDGAAVLFNYGGITQTRLRYGADVPTPTATTREEDFPPYSILDSSAMLRDAIALPNGCIVYSNTADQEGGILGLYGARICFIDSLGYLHTLRSTGWQGAMVEGLWRLQGGQVHYFPIAYTTGEWFSRAEWNHAYSLCQGGGKLWQACFADDVLTLASTSLDLNPQSIWHVMLPRDRDGASLLAEEWARTRIIYGGGRIIIGWGGRMHESKDYPQLKLTWARLDALGEPQTFHTATIADKAHIFYPFELLAAGGSLYLSYVSVDSQGQVGVIEQLDDIVYRD